MGIALICAFDELDNADCAYLYNFDKKAGTISLITIIPFSQIVVYKEIMAILFHRIIQKYILQILMAQAMKHFYTNMI